MNRTEKNFFVQYEFLIPLCLFVFFLVLTLPGISWGAPSIWHPDEIVVRSLKALFDSSYHFDEVNFDYPTLPQYVMYGLGKLILILGYSDKEILITTRVLSAILAGLTVILTYILARRVGGSIPVAGLSGLFLICVSEMEHNGRFAHNDPYILLFTTLAVLIVVEYVRGRNKYWLYASFIAIGLAASSKYIGGSLLLLPFAVYLIEQWHNLRQNLFPITETLFIGAALTFLGFSAGTPRALFSMSFYFKRVLPALQWQAEYGRHPDSLRGILGQYGVIANGLGPLALLFGAAFLWMCFRVIKAYRDQTDKQALMLTPPVILLLAIVILDLPMTFSYNYQLRYFLTLMPYLAILAAFLVEALYLQIQRIERPTYADWLGVAVAAIVIYSLVRIISLMLLVLNDARIPASAFIKTLPVGTSLEYTYYPPTIPPDHFAREHNYPVYFVKGIEPIPVSKRFKYNVGEIGLDQRQTDYFVVDSFTANKFNDPYTCQSMQVECDFFKQLATGGSPHYKLLAEFSYHLPPYLPHLRFEFINPTIRVYERIK